MNLLWKLWHGVYNWGEHERAPHRRPKHVKICIYVCMYVCMYVCLSVSLTQISLTPIATLYDNGFSGRVQNSSRAFNYPCSGQPASCALARDRRNQTAEIESSEGSLSAAARCRNKHSQGLT